MCSRNFFLYSTIFYVVMCEFKSVWCLQINNLFVPKEASHEALLDCRYSLESNETLYDVKWYKDGVEFFRCRSDGSMIQFPADGVKLLNSSESAKVGSCPLTLIGLHEKTTGEYACEVSIEFTFNAETKRSRLNFVNSTSIQKNRSVSKEGAQFVHNENLKGFMRNNANAFLLQPCFTAITILMSLSANKLIKN